jgi:hypothetical protein
MAAATRRRCAGKAANPKPLSTTNAKACWALSHQLNTGEVNTSTGNRASTETPSKAVHHKIFQTEFFKLHHFHQRQQADTITQKFGNNSLLLFMNVCKT